MDDDSLEENLTEVEARAAENDEERQLTHPELFRRDGAVRKNFKSYEKRTKVKNETKPKPSASQENKSNDNICPPTTRSKIVEFVFFRFLNAVTQAILFMVDLMLFVLCNPYVWNVILVAINVSYEIFTHIILGLVTIFIALLLNIDEAYTRFQTVRFENNTRPEREEFSEGEDELPTAENVPSRPLRVTDTPVCIGLAAGEG